MSDCKDLVRWYDPIFVAFEILPSEIANFDDRIGTLVQSNAFEKALRDALSDQASKLIANSRGRNGTANSESELSAEEGTKILTNIVESTQSKVLKEYGDQVKNSSSVQKLEAELTKFANEVKCANKNSSMGVWISENKDWLVVVGTSVGIGAALGGAAAMYYFREGDFIANLAVKALPEFKAKVAGTIDLKASVTNFKPSERTVEVKLGGDMTWNNIKISLVVTGLAHEKLLDTSAKAIVLIPIDDKSTVVGSASTKSKNLSLTGDGGSPEHNVQLNLGLQHKDNGFAFQIDATMGTDIQHGGSPVMSYGVSGKITIDF